jgi:DNA-binding XRE family transcriptional regulator
MVRGVESQEVDKYTIEQDPMFVAAQVKLLRKVFALKQQNLADLSGLTTRTIEKIESGGHRVNRNYAELR